MAADRNSGRLDQPREVPRSRFSRPSYNPETFGRASERFARFMGTATFLVYMTAFVLLWVIWNVLASPDQRFDIYPFIFLTLMLSLLDEVEVRSVNEHRPDPRHDPRGESGPAVDGSGTPGAAAASEGRRAT